MTPVSETDAAKKHNLEGPNPEHEMIASHRSAVRAAIDGFGNLGLTITGNDPDGDLRDLEAKIATNTDDLERGAMMYAMGQVERGRDNCIAAVKHWADGKKLVLAASHGVASTAQQKRRGLAFLFYGRMVVGEAFCDLAAGRAVGLSKKLQNAIVNMWAATDAERSEVRLVWGIAEFETGNAEQGKSLLLDAARRGGNEKLTKAIVTYADAVGLKL